MFDFTWGGGSYLLCLPFSESLAEKILTKLEVFYKKKMSYQKKKLKVYKLRIH